MQTIRAQEPKLEVFDLPNEGTELVIPSATAAWFDPYNAS